MFWKEVLSYNCGTFSTCEYWSSFSQKVKNLPVHDARKKWANFPVLKKIDQTIGLQSLELRVQNKLQYIQWSKVWN